MSPPRRPSRPTPACIALPSASAWPTWRVSATSCRGCENSSCTSIPLRTDFGRLEAALGASADTVVAGDDAPSSALLEIPVTYGGSAGPDLEDVAAACGLTPEEVCRRHAAVEYVVCFVGFLPGFPYLGLLDPSLRLPRRHAPRARVAPGSVAVAGEYTGIYPWASPGGWHLIGHTDEPLFDLEATPPARLAPGGRVRFVVRDR